MLINGKRALAYTVKCGQIQSIEGADNIELMSVGGWYVIVKKGEFTEGDMCVYFEIDSKLPVKPWCEFMAHKKYKVKTYKLNKFKVISQGLALPISIVPKKYQKKLNKEKVDLTDILDVTYSSIEEEMRKANDKFDLMRIRYRDQFKKYPILKKMSYMPVLKYVLLPFYGKKCGNGRFWPSWVKKTDQERVQNLGFLFPDNEDEWFVSEKIDGASTTFTLKKNGKFYVCSRNVCFETDKDEANIYYDRNIWKEMADKYLIEKALCSMIDDKNIDFITIQGETYGEGVQKRDYSSKELRFAAFSLIYGHKNGVVREVPYTEMIEILTGYAIPTVPILDTIKLPDTCDELLEYAKGKSEIDGLPREGIVLRNYKGMSFKAVDNDFMLKYHG